MASPTDEGLSLFDAAQLLHNVPYSGTTWQDLNTRTASRVTHIIYHLFDFDAWEVWKVEPKPPPPAEPSISSCGDSVKVAPACDLIAFHSRLDLVVRSKVSLALQAAPLPLWRHVYMLVFVWSILLRCSGDGW